MKTRTSKRALSSTVGVRMTDVEAMRFCGGELDVGMEEEGRSVF